MLSLTPSMTPADTHGVFKLLDLLTDPNAVRERLAELLKAKQELDATAAKAQEAMVKLAAAKTDYAGKVDSLNRVSAEHHRRQQELDARVAQLNADEIGLRDRIARHDNAHFAKTHDLDRREDEIKRREDLVVTSTHQLKQRLAEVAALKAQLEAKLAKIKEINDAVL